MTLICYYPGKCSKCDNNGKLGWSVDSTFMCCACHDILEYCDTRHGPDKITDQPEDSIVTEYIELEEQSEIPEKLYVFPVELTV